MEATRRILNAALRRPGDFAEASRSVGEATALLERLRWPDGPACPICGGREVHWYKRSPPKPACIACDRREFSMRPGTWLDGRKVALNKECTALAYLGERRTFDGMLEHLRGSIRMGDEAASKLVDALRLAVAQSGVELRPAPLQEPVGVRLEPARPMAAQKALAAPVAAPAPVERRPSRAWAAAACGAVLVLGVVALRGPGRVQAAGPVMRFEEVSPGLSVGSPATMGGEQSAAVQAALQALKEL